MKIEIKDVVARGYNLLVKREQVSNEEETTASGLVLPEAATAAKNAVPFGTVIAIGETVPHRLKGKVVFFSEGMEAPIAGYYFVRLRHVLGGVGIL